MKRSLFIFIIFLVSTVVVILIGAGCANIVPPSGGPRDTLPPALLRAEPGDSTVNFRGNNFTLYFDEYVDVRDLTNNVNFSPAFTQVPKITVRLNTINVRFRDSLLPNTTYTLNFGNAIIDINEANPLRNYEYAFSTGPRLDSGTLRGKVLLAETGGVDSTMVVVLHTNLADSAVRSRPPYFSRLDRNGNFSFRNLPNSAFALYAVSDAVSRNYTNPSQLFAFKNEPVTIGDSANNTLTLFAYRGEQPNNNRNTANTNDRRLRFNTNLPNSFLDILKPLTLTFDVPLRTFDSTKIALATDSTYTPVNNFTTSLDTGRKRVEIRTEWKDSTRYHLILQNDFAIDTAGRALLKTDTISFNTRKRADYGSLKLRVSNIDTTQNPVVQFVQGNNVVFSAPIKSGYFAQNLFLPGEYDLRILYDRNNNGKWDPGQFFGTKRQPEIALPIERKITVKAATDNDFEVSL